MLSLPVRVVDRLALKQMLIGLGRRISSIFKQTKNWRSYDLFARQKMSTFKSSRPAVLELAGRYKDIVTELQQKHTVKGAETQEQLEAAEEILFRKCARSACGATLQTCPS